MRMKAKLDVWIHSCSEINCWPLLLPCVYMQWLELYSTSLHSSSPKSFAVCFRAVDIFSKFNSCLRCRRSRDSNRRTISSDLSWTAFLSSSTWPWSSSSPVHTHTDTQIYIHVNYTSTADTYTHRHAINIHVNYTAYIHTDRQVGTKIEQATHKYIHTKIEQAMKDTAILYGEISVSCRHCTLLYTTHSYWWALEGTEKWKTA